MSELYVSGFWNRHYLGPAISLLTNFMCLRNGLALAEWVLLNLRWMGARMSRPRRTEI